MPKYMVRVLLHDATNWDMYHDLNAHMAQRGFESTLSGKKAAYHLPPAEYWFNGDQTLADVRMLAAAAAEQTGQAFGLVVVKADGWTVMRLKPVEAPEGGGDTQTLPRRRG